MKEASKQNDIPGPRRRAGMGIGVVKGVFFELSPYNIVMKFKDGDGLAS